MIIQMKNEELSDKHKKQVSELIGKKVSVYIAHKKYKRVLRRDDVGIYIFYKKNIVRCRPDTKTSNVLYFLASEPRRRCGGA